MNKLDGPQWVSWPYGTLPGMPAALLAKFVKNESGRHVLAGVLLLGDVLTADHLRRVTVSALEDSYNRTDFGGAEDLQLHAELVKLPPLERGELTGEEFSHLVARHYKVWAAYLPHPSAAMAAEWKVKPPTMASWIREARLRGLLPPARRRKVGGEQ